MYLISKCAMGLGFYIGRQSQGDSNNTEQENDETVTCLKRPKLSMQEEEYTSIKLKCQNIQLSWKQCSPLPETIAGGTAVVVGNKVYVNRGLCSNFLIRSTSSKIYEYEILENVWSNEIECPRTHFSLAVIDGLITLVGGGTTHPGQAFVIGMNTLLSLVDNAGGKQWSEFYKPMQNRRRNPATASNSRYFIVAGSDQEIHISTVEVMDLSTKEWLSPFTLPENDGYIHGATIIGDHLYLTFGHKSVRFCCPVVTCSLTTLVKSCESAATQSIIRPLLWQKLPKGPPLYRPRTLQLCGNLLAIGGYMTFDYNARKEKELYECKGSVYVYDEENGKWILVCRLPSDNGFPDNAFAVASISENKIIVMGGAQFSDDENESFPDTDIVHIGSLK